MQGVLLPFRSRIDRILKHGMIPVLALFAIIENFEFLIGHKDTYLKDIQSEVEDGVRAILFFNE